MGLAVFIGFVAGFAMILPVMLLCVLRSSSAKRKTAGRGVVRLQRVEIVPPRNEEERASATAGAPMYDLVVLVGPPAGPTHEETYRGRTYVWRHVPDGKRAKLELEFKLSELFGAAKMRGEVPDYKE